MTSFDRRPAVVSLLLAAALAVFSGGAMATPATAFHVGTARASPGRIARGDILVPAGVDAGYGIPVVVVNGRRPGPTVALIGGLHGAEFASIVALQKLAATLRAEDVGGRLIIVPLVNVAAFDAKVPHLNPVDGKNMNRVFPGSAAGTQSERAAHALVSEVIDRADYVIDYHGGDMDEDQQPYAYWIQTGAQDFDRRELGMLRAFGARYVIKFPAPGLAVDSARLLPTQAVARGKPTITVDAGRAGTYTQEDLDILVDGTLNLLAHLSMLERPLRPPVQPTFVERFLYVNSEMSGTFFPLFQHGALVAKGQKIGYVTDRYGAHGLDIVAPESAVILFQNSTPSAVAGEPLFYLGVPGRE